MDGKHDEHQPKDGTQRHSPPTADHSTYDPHSRDHGLQYPTAAARSGLHPHVVGQADLL
jgi:hypothetical protein